MSSRITVRIAGLVGIALLAGCGGGYSGTSGGGASGSSSGSAQARSMEEFFAQSVQPQMDFCRSCHVPGGIADVDKGRLFQLGSDKSQDLANFKASWERLGKNNPTSRLLLMASGQETPHTGGAPWPQGSAAYTNMEILLKCFGDPAGCVALLAGGSGATPAQFPLLGSARAGHMWFDFCEGKSDDALLPPDPRTLVQPGVNAGKAVMFNMYSKDCSIADGPGNQLPTSCGELRQRYARGKTLMSSNGSFGGGRIVAGDHNDGVFQMSAAKYNKLWQSWGLSERPANFDQLVAERYGMAMGTERNPYPLPGEDPNKTNGGSGQLSMAFSQGRNEDGSWTGFVAPHCNACHADQIGTAKDGPGFGVTYGGNGTVDTELWIKEVWLESDYILGAVIPAAKLAPLSFGTLRGVNAAFDAQLIPFLTLEINPLDPNLAPALLLGSNLGDTSPPAWWNEGHKLAKFSNALMPISEVRTNQMGFAPIARQVPYDMPEVKRWVKENALNSEIWFMSLKSPAFPGPIDTALAEQGAILFHSKDLWAKGLDNPVPRPEGGNGSCAGCHGAYSPRYVNDPAYLDTPELEGMTGYVTPKEIIGTDPVHIDGMTEAAAEYGSKNNFYAYSDTYGTEQDCTIQTRKALAGDRKPGYYPQPLYGVWATPPYFHNGAVPSVWEVLKPSDRKPMWRRVSKPALPEQQGKVVMGFDTDFQRAYDQQKLGWKYDEVLCGVGGAMPYLECDPSDASKPPLLQQLLSQLYSTSPLLFKVVPPTLLGPPALILTNEQIEQRKIYNTHFYGLGNQGHEFTSVLTDPERRALIEYLKTL